MRSVNLQWRSMKCLKANGITRTMDLVDTGVITKVITRRRIKNCGTIRIKSHGTTMIRKIRKRSHGKRKSPNLRTRFTFPKDVKFFCPTDFDESIFAAVCKLLQEKVEQAKKTGADNARTISAFEKDNFMSFFNYSRPCLQCSNLTDQW